MTEFTKEKLAELRAVAEAVEPSYYACDCSDMCRGGCPDLKPVYATIDNETVLALIAALEAKTAEVEELRAWKKRVIERVRDTTTGQPSPAGTDYGELIDRLKRERDEARAEVDGLADDGGHKAAKYWKWWQREKARADRAEAAIERVKKQHTKRDDGWCAACSEFHDDGTPQDWPCPTVQALTTKED